MTTVESEVAEMDAMQKAQAEKAAEHYLEAVGRSAVDDPLPTETKLKLLASVGVDLAAFGADVERKKRRAVCKAKITEKASHLAALDAARESRADILARKSAELVALNAKFAAEFAVVDEAADAADAALEEIAAAEKYLAESEGITALTPNPVRLETGMIIRVNMERVVIVNAETGWPREHELRGEQLGGLPLTKELEGRQVSLVRYHHTERGELLRIVG